MGGYLVTALSLSLALLTALAPTSLASGQDQPGGAKVPSGETPAANAVVSTTVKVTPTRTSFTAGETAIAAILLESVVVPAKDTNTTELEALRMGVTVTVEVVSGECWVVHGRDLLSRAEVKTQSDGRAFVDLHLGQGQTPVVLRVSAARDGVSVPVSDNELLLPVQAYVKTLMSDRVTTELVLGALFQDKYTPITDADGNVTGYQSEGFADQQAFGQLSFDTMWPIRIATQPSNTAYDERRCKVHPGAKTRCFEGTQLRTRLDLRFASFPVTGSNSGTTPDAEHFTDFADSLTTALTFAFEPKWLSLYERSSKRSETPWDAFRLAAVVRAGFTTRDRLDNEDPTIADTLVYHGGVGLRFTHHQTDSPGNADLVNTIPLRFFEASVMRYEEYAGREGVNRVVLEAGLRLPVISGDAVPLYVGAYANVGDGPDDVRFFAAFIFQLDKLATLLGK